MSKRTVLAVSPHLDDAALSIGATLAELSLLGFDVHVLTLFTAVPLGHRSDAATAFHQNCGFPLDASPGPLRCREDELAMGDVRATPHHAGLSDAVYRRLPDGRWLCQHERAMFDQDLPAEPPVQHAAKNAIGDIIRLVRPQLVLTCGAIGAHIDHILTKAAVLELTAALALRVLLWEDLPYAIDETPDLSGRQAVLRFPRHRAWDAKWRAVARYKSQIRMLWPPDIGWRELLERHAYRQGGHARAELLWHPRQPEPSGPYESPTEMPYG